MSSSASHIWWSTYLLTYVSIYPFTSLLTRPMNRQVAISPSAKKYLYVCLDPHPQLGDASVCLSFTLNWKMHECVFDSILINLSVYFNDRLRYFCQDSIDSITEICHVLEISVAWYEYEWFRSWENNTIVGIMLSHHCQSKRKNAQSSVNVHFALLMIKKKMSGHFFRLNLGWWQSIIPTILSFSHHLNHSYSYQANDVFSIYHS